MRPRATTSRPSSEVWGMSLQCSARPKNWWEWTMTTSEKASGKAKTVEVWEDPIVAEVRAVRDKIAAQFDYDIGRIFDHFVSLDKERRKKATEGPPRTPKTRR